MDNERRLKILWEISDPAEIWLAAQEIQANGLEMRPPPLQLLGYAVHVPQPPFKGLIVKYRGGAGLVIDLMNDIPRRMDRECRRLPHRDTVFHRQGAGPFDIFPHVVQHRDQPGFGGLQRRVRISNHMLHRMRSEEHTSE